MTRQKTSQLHYLVLILLISTSDLFGQATQPFVCDPDVFYMTHGSTINTDLYFVNKSTNPFGFTPIGGGGSPINSQTVGLNALAFNGIDSYLYAATANTWMSNNTIYRIDRNGNYSPLTLRPTNGSVLDPQFEYFHAGTFLPDGRWVIVTDDPSAVSNGTTQHLWVADVNNPGGPIVTQRLSLTSLGLPADTRTWDIQYDPFQDMIFLFRLTGSGLDIVDKLDPSNGFQVVSSTPIPASPNRPINNGATFVDVDGFHWIYSSIPGEVNGIMWRYDPVSNTFTAENEILPAPWRDGASCITDRFDYGDAPDTYGTDQADGGEGVGPSHLIAVGFQLRLGALIDEDGDGVPAVGSDGDDQSGDDEDGITLAGLDFQNAILSQSQQYNVNVSVTGGSGFLTAWFDWNSNGSFDAGEQEASELAVSTGSTILDIVVPSLAVTGTSYARFRLCDGLGECNTPNGASDSGEVEDYIVQIDAALPVELSSFDVLTTGRDVSLFWETASEENNAGFEVQHSWNGELYSTLEFIEGRGSETETTRYQSKVRNLSPGISKFRLRQIDLDGSFAYSSEVEVNIDIPNDFLLEPAYPNPFNPSTQIRLTVNNGQDVQLSLFDLSGRVLKELFNGRVNGGATKTFSVNGTNLNSGIYIVQIKGEDFVASDKIVLIK